MRASAIDLHRGAMVPAPTALTKIRRDDEECQSSSLLKASPPGVRAARAFFAPISRHYDRDGIGASSWLWARIVRAYLYDFKAAE